MTDKAIKLKLYDKVWVKNAENERWNLRYFAKWNKAGQICCLRDNAIPLLDKDVDDVETWNLYRFTDPELLDPIESRTRGKWTVAEIWAWKKQLKRELLSNLQSFEEASGCTVESIDLSRLNYYPYELTNLTITLKL